MNIPDHLPEININIFIIVSLINFAVIKWIKMSTFSNKHFVVSAFIRNEARQLRKKIAIWRLICNRVSILYVLVLFSNIRHNLEKRAELRQSELANAVTTTLTQ